MLHTRDTQWWWQEASSSSSLFIFKYRFFQYLCYKARKFHEVTTNLPCVTVIRRHRGELKWNLHDAWQCGQWPVPHVHHVFVFELSLKLLVVFLKDEDKLWVKEEDVVIVISEQVCLHNVQHLSTEIHWHVSGANCCLPVHRLHTDVMMWSTMLGWKKSKNNKWREAGSRVRSEGVQRRHSCGCCRSGFKDSLGLVWLHWNSSPWDFTLWFHGMCVGVKMGDINRRAISTGI